MLAVCLAITFGCLGHPVYKIREAATRSAVRLGEFGGPILVRRAESGDAEVRHRARAAHNAILDAIRFAANPCDHCKGSRVCPDFRQPTDEEPAAWCPKCQGAICRGCVKFES